MTVLYAIAMAALALAPLLAFAVDVRVGPRVSAACSAAGCVLLVIVGVGAALKTSVPTISLGGWLGFGHSALHDDGLAGIFLALTGVTGAAVSLASLQFPAGGRDRRRQRL
jgi:formate hydrogenlyase subunit 3/multisubunit Na+/H+ antiporter MnhD subunit